MLTVKDVLTDWIQEKYTQYQDIHYPVQCTEDIVRIYGYRAVDIHPDRIICYWWQWTTQQRMRESTLHLADPCFFDKLQEFIEWRLRIGL